MQSPSNVYKELFKADPFLIHEWNFQFFGDSIVEHLFGYRLDVALPKPNPNSEYKDGQNSDFQWDTSDADALKNKYYDSVKKRQKLDANKAETKALRQITMVSDGTRTSGRHTQIPSLAADDKQTNRLRIAAVGHRVGISNLSHEASLNEYLKVSHFKAPPLDTIFPESETGLVSRTQLSDENSGKRWWKVYCRLLKTALEGGSDIVVFPEFGLPPDMPGLQAETIIEEAIAASKQSSVFVFSGTRHEGLSNRGLIVSKQNDKVEKSAWQYKVASARRLKENILGNGAESHPVHSFSIPKAGFEGPVAISIPICYDTIDPSIFVNLIRQAREIEQENEIHIILVPAYNPSSDFIALLRELSFLSRSVVLYQDGLHGEAKMFVGGFAIEDIMNPDHVTRAIAAMGAKIESIDIQLGELKSKKTLEETRGIVDKRFKNHKKRLNQKKVILQLFKESLHASSHRGDLKDMLKTIYLAEGNQCTSEKLDTLLYDIDMVLIKQILEFRIRYFESDQIESLSKFLSSVELI